MTISHRERTLTIKEAAGLAEFQVSSQAYRDALNAPYTSDISEEEHLRAVKSKELADRIILEAMRSMGPRINIKEALIDSKEAKWEMARRTVVNRLLGSTALGSFDNFFLGRDSVEPIAEAEPSLLGEGNHFVVALNTRLMRHGRDIEDPIEFFDTSLGVIDRQSKAGKDHIGPENYATTLKLFADKFSAIDNEEDQTTTDALTLPDMKDTKQLVTEALKGFFAVAKRDTPNYVEMTNIFSAIRLLPKGVVDPQFSRDILYYATLNLHEFDTRTTLPLFAALSRIDTSQYPLETSSIVNLAMRRIGQFETTRALRTTVRVLDTLSKNPQTDAAIDEFLNRAEGFDRPLDLEGVDEVMDRLARIVHLRTDDRELSVRSVSFAEKCLRQANRLTRQLLANGTLTQPQMTQLKKTYFRIKENYEKI